MSPRTLSCAATLMHSDQHNSFLSRSHNGLHTIRSECQWHETKANELGWRLKGSTMSAHINLPQRKDPATAFDELWHLVQVELAIFSTCQFEYCSDKPAFIFNLSAFSTLTFFFVFFGWTVLLRWPDNEWTYVGCPTELNNPSSSN